MNNIKNNPRPLFVFYLLVAYVFLQFSWWTFLMVRQNNEIYKQRAEFIIIKSKDAATATQAEEELRKELQKRWLMVMGEGTVFLALMILGIVKIKNTFQSEAALARQQKNFLLSVTHELKSPLASTKLQLQTLLKRELSMEQQREIITNAIVDTERLNHLVENILLAAKIDNSVSHLHKETTRLDEFINTIFSKIVPSYNIKQKIVLDLEEEIFMDIDRISFPSIVLNLLENAGKYSKKDSEIFISLKKKGKQIYLTFADHGIGVPDIEKQLIFRKFYRLGNEETRKTKGTGLGLYIVQHLVEEHGGEITVRDNLPEGSIFEVVFGC